MAGMYKTTLRGCVFCGSSINDNTIGSSVKMNAGRPRDVEIVQQLLNAVPAFDGGPTVLLEVDGICGSKTSAAISRFQSKSFGWSDGAVDPKGKTITRLVDYVCDTPTVPYGPVSAKAPKNAAPQQNAGGGAGATKPEDIPGTAAHGVVTVTYANALMRVMEPSINALRWKLTRVDKTFEAFLNKHFESHKVKINKADIGHIQNIVARIHHYIARFNAFGKLPIENVLLYDAATGPNVIARTVRGGDKMSTKQIQIYVDNGVVSKNPGQSVWLGPIWGNQPTYEKHWTLLHEMAHFVGPRDGTGGTIDDHAYAFHNHFLDLGKWFKLRCAESISLFMLEWCFGTDAVTELPRLATHAHHFRQFPHVEHRRMIAGP